MTIILFLVDTSASMCQKAYVNGVKKTYLDIAKGAVETFLKYRQRSVDCMGDRYMLLTFEDPPCNVKAGWKENHATFMNELKNLQCNGLTSMREALKNAFDLLNLNRMQSGIDTYGQGRCPFYLEPSVIIVITDSGKYSFRNGIHSEVTTPLHTQIPGTRFNKEAFRWDQRLFSLSLRMAGNKLDERVDGKVPHDDSPIEKMCEQTGGRSYRIKSQYVLNQCIESLVQKVQPGVVVHFEQLVMTKDLKDGEVQDIAFQSTKKMIYVFKHPSQKTFPVGYWPIPEPYWPDSKAITLPLRDAHPQIKIITPCVDEPQTVRNFPVDKYELEASPLTLQILSKRDPTKCWLVVVPNHTTHGVDMPFGYLKANNSFTQVHLTVLPYNFQALLPILNELYQKYNLNPPNDWYYKFSHYVRSIPQYYCPFLRRALSASNVPYPLLQYVLPDNLDGYLSPTVANYLKQIKNTAKSDQEALCLRVFKQLKQPKLPYHPLDMTKLYCGQPLKRDLVTHPMLKDTFSKLHNEINTFENYNIVVPTMFKSVTHRNYMNPFDIPRKDLIDEIASMRDNFFKIPTSSGNMFTKDAEHSLPIAEMGNYQEYLKNKEPPLREIEPTNVRQHMFGNPYKKDKHMVMVDEADLGDVAPMRSTNAPNTPKKVEMSKRKRKAGPIRKDFIFRRTSTNSRESVSSSSSVSSAPMSDTDDDSTSDAASSMLDDGDENRLVVDFPDFNEPAVEDFRMNGHIQDFINGDMEDETPPQIPPIPVIAPLIISPTPPPPQVPNTINSINNATSSNNHHTQISIPPPQSTSTTASNPQSHVSTSPFNQNDINDAQEISKILQQCHKNGGNVSESNHHHHLNANHHSHNNMNNQQQTNEKEEIKEEEVENMEPKVSTDENHIILEEMDEEMKENIKQQNIEIRTIVFKDIRRPGRDYSALLEHLNLFKGDFVTRFNCIQMCINESLRFRRRKMADSIQDWWENQIDSIST